MSCDSRSRACVSNAKEEHDFDGTRRNIAMGPIELTDFVGLDTSEKFQFLELCNGGEGSHGDDIALFALAKHILDGWREKLDNGETSIPADLLGESRLINEKVAEGKLGHKTGEGLLKH